MDKVPPTQKTDLDKTQEQLDAEAREWSKLGMHPNMTQHSNESMWMFKMQVQSLIDILIKKDVFTEDEINLIYKQLMLIDMQRMREQAMNQRREALVPEMNLLGPDGKPFKL